MRCLRLAAFAVLAGLVALRSPSPAADPFFGADPAWSLLHEPAVARELTLTPTQSRQFCGILNELERFFPLRNKPREEATKGALKYWPRRQPASRQCFQIDGTKTNWNEWGNSMWPSVYLVDKRGYLRHFWPGEMKWQGGTGDQWMRDRIEELLAEPTSARSND